MDGSRRLIRVLPLLAGGAVLVAACDLIPGTSANIERRAKDLAAEQLIDPASAQFRSVEVRDGAVCGEINGKNRMGAYVGFTRFLIDTSAWEAALDPGFDPGQLETARSLCSSIGGSSCSDAAELEGKRIAQLAFEERWEEKCVGAGAAGALDARMPWDPTAFNEAGPGENWVEDYDMPNANSARANSASSRASDDAWMDGEDDEGVAETANSAGRAAEEDVGAIDAANGVASNVMDED
jgi:hypothetical protein